MRVIETTLPGVLTVEPQVFEDYRGWFIETFHAQRYEELGIASTFLQDNWSHSVKNTLRGLHFQEPRSQGKLIQVVVGSVFDVVVDVRRNSPSFGKWLSIELSDQNHQQLWVPRGFAHGFCVLSEVADVHYKCTDVYVPDADRGIIWNDPDLNIPWPVKEPILSKKDRTHPRLRDAQLLPIYGRHY